MLTPERSPHIRKAHLLWADHIKPGDLVIDATCGNGKDSLLLAQLSQGNLIALDIQNEAINITKTLLLESLDQKVFQNVKLIQTSHRVFPKEVKEGSVTAIIYNLGYLPGGDKRLTTLTKTTLESVNHGLNLLKAGGFLSITCYPGHPEGALEESELLHWANTLPSPPFTVSHDTWNHHLKHPSLLTVYKSNC